MEDGYLCLSSTFDAGRMEAVVRMTGSGVGGGGGCKSGVMFTGQAHNTLP